MVMFDLTLQGRAHIRENLPCQDKTVTMEWNGTRCIALADGAGSAKLSHFGAQAAVDAVAALLCQNFIEFYMSSSPEKVKRNIIKSVHEALDAVTKKHGCQLRDLASTLLFAAVKDDMYITGQLGDGAIVFCRNGELKLSRKPERGEFANQTWFTTTLNSENHFHLFKGVLSGITGFFIMSDGAAESLYQRKTEKLAKIIKYIMIASYFKEKSYFMQTMTSFFQEHIISRTIDDCAVASISLYNSYAELFNSIDNNETYRLFYKKRSKKEYTNDYINILLNSSNANNIEDLSKITQICTKTLKLRIRRLRDLGFALVTNKFY